MFTRLSIIGAIALSLIVLSVCAFAVRASGTSQTMTGGSVALPFRGEWVPAKARCTSPLRLIIEPNTVTFVKGDDREEFRKLEQCFTCMGHDVTDVTLLSTDAMGDSPFRSTSTGRRERPPCRLNFPTIRS